MNNQVSDTGSDELPVFFSYKEQTAPVVRVQSALAQKHFYLFSHYCTGACVESKICSLCT
jgi:hypothetical protein